MIVRESSKHENQKLLSLHVTIQAVGKLTIDLQASCSPRF